MEELPIEEVDSEEEDYTFGELNEVVSKVKTLLVDWQTRGKDLPRNEKDLEAFISKACFVKRKMELKETIRILILIEALKQVDQTKEEAISEKEEFQALVEKQQNLAQNKKKLDALLWKVTETKQIKRILVSRQKHIKFNENLCKIQQSAKASRIFFNTHPVHVNIVAHYLKHLFKKQIMETEGTLPVHTMGILFTIMCLPTLRHNIPPREVIGALAEGGAIRVEVEDEWIAYDPAKLVERKKKRKISCWMIFFMFLLYSSFGLVGAVFYGNNM